MAIIDESRVAIDVLRGYDDRLAVLRLDDLHPVISGNKWFKLYYNINAAFEAEKHTILSFGGAHSNHLVATAAVAADAGLNSIGIVRGEDWQQNKTITLRECERYGMQLYFVSREEYSAGIHGAAAQKLIQHTNALAIPEGGANEQGRRGAAEIARLIPKHYAHVCVSVGSGTTFAGIAAALPGNVRLHGYAPLKGGAYLMDEVRPFIPEGKQWDITDAYHFGGFGKRTDELVAFMNTFYEQQGVPLDVVYTAKMMYGVLQDMEVGKFDNNSKVLCIHTGGLQGNAAIYHRLLY